MLDLLSITHSINNRWLVTCSMAVNIMFYQCFHHMTPSHRCLRSTEENHEMPPSLGQLPGSPDARDIWYLCSIWNIKCVRRYQLYFAVMYCAVLVLCVLNVLYITELCCTECTDCTVYKTSSLRDKR